MVHCPEAAEWKMSRDVGLPAGGAYIVFLGVLYWVVLCVGIHAVFKQYKVAQPSVEDPVLVRLLKSREFWFRLIFVAICCFWGLPLVFDSCRNCDKSKPDYCNNWVVLWLYGVFFIATSNFASRPLDFYLGEGRTPLQMFNFYFRGKAYPSTEEIEAAALSKKRTGTGSVDYQVGFGTLMPSVFVTWVFAKSINNASVLGGEYGMLGGLAYASWYISFFTVGIVIYLLRTRYGFKSLSEAVYTNYGSLGVICYQFAVMFRCWSEVWSNATVIGSFFGPSGSSGWWGAAWLSVLIPLTYSIMGGMRASLVSDLVQAFLGVLFLFIVLVTIGADKDFQKSAGNTFTWEPNHFYKAEVSGSGWLNGWWACLIGGLIQGVCSYPFFDPILTDRGFLSSPKTMLMSFIVGGFVAAWFIFFYAAIGVYGAYHTELFQTECDCGAANPVASAMCPTSFDACHLWSKSAGSPSYSAYVLGRQTYGAVEVFIGVTMITASMASVDSAFTCWGKLTSLDFGGWCQFDGDKREVAGPLRPHDAANIGHSHMLVARCSCVFMAIASVVFLGTEKNAMSATSAAGTMVMGIGAPIWAMTFWQNKSEGRRGWVQAPLAFAAPFAIGIMFGSFYYLDGKVGKGRTYDHFTLGDKSYSYSRFLGVNLWGHLICLAIFIVCFGFHQLFPKLWFWPLPEVEFVAREAEAEVASPDVMLEEAKPAAEPVEDVAGKKIEVETVFGTVQVAM